MYTLYSKYMHAYMYNKSYMAQFNVTKSKNIVSPQVYNGSLYVFTFQYTMSISALLI